MDRCERIRTFYEKLREQPTWEHKRAMLAVQGYPIPANEHETELIVKTLGFATAIRRSGGMH